MLTVILSTYNDERNIKESLISIKNQTFKNFTALIFNDGSTDNTAKIIKEIIDDDNRFILYENKKNMGLAYNLNKGISLSSTKYIARMDADDIALPNRFEEQITFLENNPIYSLCGTNAYYIDDTGIWGERLCPEYIKKKDFISVCPYIHPTIVFRTCALKKVLENDSEIYCQSSFIGRSEDYDLFMRMESLNLKGYNIQKNLLKYREDKNSYKKRKFKYAFTESIVRLRGYIKLKINPLYYIYCFKPIILYTLPLPIIISLHNKKIKKRSSTHEL